MYFEIIIEIAFILRKINKRIGDMDYFTIFNFSKPW
jgi:hypothetical protein